MNDDRFNDLVRTALVADEIEELLGGRPRRRAVRDGRASRATRSFPHRWTFLPIVTATAAAIVLIVWLSNRPVADSSHPAVATGPLSDYAAPRIFTSTQFGWKKVADPARPTTNKTRDDFVVRLELAQTSDVAVVHIDDDGGRTMLASAAKGGRLVHRVIAGLPADLGGFDWQERKATSTTSQTEQLLVIARPVDPKNPDTFADISGMFNQIGRDIPLDELVLRLNNDFGCQTQLMPLLPRWPSTNASEDSNTNGHNTRLAE